MTESIADNDYLSVGCILLTHFWGAFKQGLLTD